MELACNETKEITEQIISGMVKEAMANRHIEIDKILAKSSFVEVDNHEKYFTVFSAVAMWDE